jgi:N-acetylglucosaminyldiphosphoundecaprenol N-acetyl-beta-D-mannosaminyltransferase
LPNLSTSHVIAWPEKYDLIGVQVSNVDYDHAIQCIMHAARHSQPVIVACHAVHAIVTASCDQELREQVNEFAMITPDGQPVRWGLNLLHRTGLTDRVYGPELTLRVCHAAAQEGVSIYLYGGTPEVLELLQANLKKEVRGLAFAGAEAPPFRALSDEENDQACKRINESGAGVVMIGLGCPKQDYFAAKNRDRIKSVQLLVGAAFDFHAGVKPMAPSWMQKSGLEWLFRLMCEPRRLWHRYLVTNSTYLFRLGISLLRKPFTA